MRGFCHIDGRHAHIWNCKALCIALSGTNSSGKEYNELRRIRPKKCRDGTGTDRTILSGIHEFYEPEMLVGKTLIAITNLPPRAMMGIESCGMLLSAVHNEEGEEKLNLLMVDNRIPAGAKLY